MYLINELKKIKEPTWQEKNALTVYKKLIDGKIYAQIASVSKSGMSRRILFFYADGDIIRRATAEIAWLCGDVKVGEIKQGQKYLIEDGLRVGGCGMDMVFYTLSRCVPHDNKKDEKRWGQRYSTL